MIPGLKDIITSGIEGITNSAANIIGKFKADPTKVAELDSDLQKLKTDAVLEAERITNQAEEIQAKELETVNATMREESKSEHFLTFSWRPLIGYAFILVIINNYVIVPYLAKHGVQVIVIPDNVWSAILVILGAASAGRGLTQWQKAKNDS